MLEDSEVKISNRLYVFPCVILFLCFSVLLVLRLPRLGKRELTLVLFVRLFGLCLFRFVGFLFLLGLGRAAVCDCGTSWTFLLLVFLSNETYEPAGLPCGFKGNEASKEPKHLYILLLL